MLGWGSLVWDPRQLDVGEWQSIELKLPLEFSRISEDGRLTLVIDYLHGEEVPLLVATSRKPTVEEAVANLADREGCDLGRIGVVTGTESRSSVPPAAGERIRAWTHASGWDATIWTGLGPKFKDKLRVPFTIENAIAYLESLRGISRTLAVEYITKAPIQIQTPLRRALTGRGWAREAFEA